jgi:glutamate/tyrosine decarboxylase-like PLP-dependent enzyme
MRDSFDYSASYLQAETDSEEKWDWMKYTFQLSRCFRALKVWMQFEVYGSLKLKAVIADNIRLMRHLGGEISRSTDFELIAPVSLSIVCFRYVSNSEHCNGEADLDRLNTQILEESEKQGSFFLTGTKLNGHTVLRACLVNHRTTEVETSALIKHIRSLGEKIAGAKAEIERDIYLGAGI